MIKRFGVVVVGQATFGADRLSRQTFGPIQERPDGAMFALPALLNRIHRQGEQLEAGPAGHGAAHIANHEMGGPQAQVLVLNQKPIDRTQIPPRAKHVQHPMPLAFQPAIEGTPLGQWAPQQGAIEVGDKHQLGMVGQGSRKLLQQKLAGVKVARRRHGSPQGWATHGEARLAANSHP